MCCRFLLLERHYREILQRLGVIGAANFLSRYNVAPGTEISVVRTKPGRRKPAPAASHEAVALRWGLVPSWSKSDEGTKLMNARAETLTEKPSFRDAYRFRRGIIPASGFYEWAKVGRARRGWVFRWKNEQAFGLAALWENWNAPDGTVLESCAVITVAPNELMQPIHHRMPVMLTPDQFEQWLDPDITAPEKLAPLLRQPSAAAMSATRVGPYVNSIEHEGPECLAPPEDDEDDEPQLSLGL
jgi:putative SOS response-associated peptidase YedK